LKNRLGIEPVSVREGIFLTLAALGVFFSTILALKATTVSTGEMAIWPADAIALAMMLLMKQRPVLALLTCRTASAAVSFATGFPALPAFAVNLASVLGIVFVYLALYLSKRRQMYEVRGLLGLFCLSAIGSGISAPLQATALTLFDKTSFLRVFESCFAANLIGIVVIVPTMMLMFDRKPLTHSEKKEWAGKTRAFLAYTLGVCLVFYVRDVPLLFLVPMGLVAVAYVADVGTVAISVLATAVIASVATVLGYGRFTVNHATPSTQLMMLQFFLGVITLFALPTAALIWEHRRLKEVLIVDKVEAEAASSAKSRFLAMISHEIRTPLNGVLGMAQIMAMNELQSDQAERLKVIRRSGEILLAILNDVLDLSKIEAGKLELETIEFDLEEVLRSTSHSYSPLAREKGLVYSQDIDAVAGLYRGDPTRLRQIFANLLSNALKFTEKGEIRISASFADDVLRLAVSDTGIGIPSHQLDKLFAKFTQADETTTRRFGGTGLGLSICSELATMMGGRIDVESEAGAGSCFTAVIPLIRLGDVAPPEADPELMESAFGAGRRVLAAEDNATNQLVLRTLLEMADFEVCIVGNGEEAVVAWESQDWDLILMDVQMPVMDGPDATRAIRAREAESGRARTPILALTANTMAHQVNGYLADGMDGHIAKPIDAETLFRSILDVIVQPNDRADAALEATA
jgi:signal transduction histidine kinase/AmiR/NasT family two-component response regulator